MAYRTQRDSWIGFTGMPIVVENLLLINLVFFVAQMVMPGVLETWLALWPLSSHQLPPAVVEANSLGLFYPWQLLTYGFLHWDIYHIILNMYVLFLFGTTLERELGPKRFLIYFLTCVVGAGIIQLLVCHFGNSFHWTVGASGGTFGLLMAFALFFPRQEIQLLFPPIILEARWFVLIFGGLELVLGVSRLNTGIAHFAHLGGMLFGFLLISYWRGKLPVKPKWPIRF